MSKYTDTVDYEAEYNRLRAENKRLMRENQMLNDSLFNVFCVERKLRRANGMLNDLVKNYKSLIELYEEQNEAYRDMN